MIPYDLMQEPATMGFDQRGAVAQECNSYIVMGSPVLFCEPVLLDSSFQ